MRPRTRMNRRNMTRKSLKQINLTDLFKKMKAPINSFIITRRRLMKKGKTYGGSCGASCGVHHGASCGGASGGASGGSRRK